jgi:hypothetical protein
VTDEKWWRRPAGVSEAYSTPQALRQALDDRLRQLTKDRPGAQLADLQRQFAYDRLLGRVFRADKEGWVLKGATAMLARLGPLARHTMDVDLYRRDPDLETAERALREAVAFDLGDHFRFALTPGRRVIQDGVASRISVVAYIGAAEFARFHVDLVASIQMTAAPDDVPPLVPLAVPGLSRGGYRAYPVPDHIADKVCAMFEVHEQGGRPVQSTRYRDLADLAIFAHTQWVSAESIKLALNSEARRRGLQLPAVLDMAAGPGWRAGYARVVRDAPLLKERDLDSALETVRTFIEPVLSGNAAGVWDPDRFEWIPEG